MFNKYPYTDFHELNLDWILAKVKELDIKMDLFEVTNSISYHGAWDITEQYAAWAIVEDDNKLYISIKPVPAGVYLSNTEYWKILIDFTQEIEDIAEIVEALTYKKRYIFIADSYGDKPSLGYDTWVELVPAYMGLPASDYHTVVSNGAGFYTAGVNGTWLQALQNEEPNIDEREKISNIIVGGWLNDINVSEANVKGAVNMFCDYVEATYPNAKITVMPFDMTLVMNANHILTETVQVMTISRYYREALNARGIGTVCNDAMTFLRNTKLMLPDKRHPTSAGEVYLSRCVANTLLGLDANIPEDYTVDITPLDTGVSVYGTNNGGFNTWHKGTNAGMKSSKGVELVFATPQSISNSTYTIQFDDTCYLPLGGYRKNVECILVDSSNVQSQTQCVAQYVGDCLQLTVYGVHNNISHVYVDGLTAGDDALY